MGRKRGEDSRQTGRGAVSPNFTPVFFFSETSIRFNADFFDERREEMSGSQCSRTQGRH
jgi:hypothetical protein